MLTIGSSSEILRKYPLKEAAARLKSLGYDTIEIWMGHYFMSGLQPKDVQKIMQELDLRYQVHEDVRDVNLTSTNKGIQQESLRQTLETIELTSEMGAEVLTIHPGRMSSSKDQTEDFWPKQIETFKKIAAHAEKHNVKVGVENMEKRAKEFVLNIEDVHKLIQSVDSSHLGLTMDLAHYHSVGDVKEFVQNVEVPIFNVHISQASPKKMHLPFETDHEGIIEFEEVLPEVAKKYDGPLVIESYVHGKEIEMVEDNYAWLKGCLEQCK